MPPEEAESKGKPSHSRRLCTTLFATKGLCPDFERLGLNQGHAEFRVLQDWGTCSYSSTWELIAFLVRPTGKQTMTISTENTPATNAQLLRVLLVDDHDLVRQGLRSMLEAQEGWMICGEASTGLEAIELSKQLRPDIAIVDIHMPGMDGLQATRQILMANPQIEVLILTLDETESVLMRRNRWCRPLRQPGREGL